MDIIVIVLIALVIIVLLAVGFALLRKKQRSGSVLAAPDSMKNGRGRQ